MPPTETTVPRASKPDRLPMAAIIMAAGAGTRMHAQSLLKACFPVAGVPAVNRIIRACRRSGIDTIVVVVGAGGDQVMQTVSAEHAGVLYAHQPETRGTGHAVRVGFEPLRRMGFGGLVWCLVGDKVVEPGAFRAVLSALEGGDADAAFAVTDKPGRTDMGRVLQDQDGSVRGIVESRDLRVAQMLDALAGESRGLLAEVLRKRCLDAVGSQARCEQFLAKLRRLASSGGRISARRLRAALPRLAGKLRIGNQWLTHEEVAAASPYRNESLYCFHADTLAAGLDLLPKPTAEGEQYFTDIVAALVHPRHGPRARIRAALIADPELIMGFNTPEQLLAVDAAVRKRGPATVRASRRTARLSARISKPVREWVRLFQEMPLRLRRSLQEVYGDQAQVIEARRRTALKALRAFGRAYGGDRKAVVVRAPGAVNLMGRHVDEFGGHVNPMPVDREILFVASPRQDDVVQVLQAGGAKGSATQFSVTQEIGALGWDDWLNYISSAKVRQMIVAARSDWSSPVRAAVLRIQQQFRTRRLCGMDAVVADDIPAAAGLGASSALMVAASEAYALLNGLGLKPEEIVGLCGEGQRFLGSDLPPSGHAAAKFGRRGYITRLRFDPFEVGSGVPWPSGARLVLCRMPAGARATPSDHRRMVSAAMEMGLMFLRDRFPSMAHVLERLGDVQPNRLDVTPSRIYEMLLRVPQHTSPASARRALSRPNRGRLDALLETHEPVGTYPVRDVLLYGIAECRRAEVFAGLLARGDLSGLGRLMCVSHDAERARGVSTGDATLRSLKDDLISEEPERVRAAQIEFQPGHYGSSTSEIDAVVDAAVRLPGVLGAQLSGSGLGGCVMVLVESEAAAGVARTLTRSGKGTQARLLTPVASSSVIRT